MIIIIVAVAVVIPIGVYTIYPLFISNSVNEPLPTTAAIASNNSASHEYQKFISMNEQNRMNAA
jgi:flagellar basal body-associated protein FliL